MRKLALVAALIGLASCQPVNDGASGLHLTIERGACVSTQKACVLISTSGATTSTPTTTVTPTTNLSVPVSAVP